jgi:hypothetical protein
MKNRMSEEEFTLVYDAIWESGPQVRYLNPDSWVNNHQPERLF